MKIAIINPVRAKISGGYREYLNQILSRAEADPRVKRILFLSIPSVCAAFSHYKKVEIGNIGSWYHFNPNNSRLRNTLSAFEPDVLYSPVEKRVPLMGSTPRVIMVQNMEPLVPMFSDNSWIQSLRIWFLRQMAVKAIRNCDHIIALSDFVFEHLVSQYNVPEKMITKIPHGADLKQELKAIQPVAAKAEDMFLFTAGSISPARGLEDIINAFIELKKAGHNNKLKLYIAGEVQRYSKKYFKNLLHSLNQAGCENDVCWLGFVSQAEMKWCYQHCCIFVMTSRVESFGIIALEAMSYGVPVISSTSPCLPEVFEEYAVYYKPGDYKELSGHIETLIAGKEDLARKTHLSVNEQYDWNKSYNSTISLFLDLARQNKQTI